VDVSRGEICRLKTKSGLIGKELESFLIAQLSIRNFKSSPADEAVGAEESEWVPRPFHFGKARFSLLTIRFNRSIPEFATATMA